MKSSLLLSVTALFLSAQSAHAGWGSAPPPPPAPDFKPLLAEPVVGPVAHTAARDQADVGFCWAYSLSGYMEGEALKKGHSVTLSPEYLALNHMPSLMYDFLPLFENIDSRGFFARVLLDVLVLPSISSQGSASFSEGLSDLSRIGMVPETFYKQKFPLGGTPDKPVEIHPTLQDRVEKFVMGKLTDKTAVLNYEKDPEGFRKDFYDAIGQHPPGPTDTFTYEGKTYTPITFMKDYLEFDPADYQEVVVMKGKFASIFDKFTAAGLDMNAIQHETFPTPFTGLNQGDALRLIDDVLQQQTAVPVTYIVYEDQKAAEKSGVFSPQNCAGGSCTKTAGGHAVLITGLKHNPSVSGDPIDALIIKNSWGNIGLDDQGQVTATATDRGFFLITPPYLSEAENQANSNGWSFLVPKRFIPSK